MSNILRFSFYTILKYVAIFIGFKILLLKVGYFVIELTMGYEFAVTNFYVTKSLSWIFALYLTYICAKIENGEILKDKSRRKKIVKWILIIGTLGLALYIYRKKRGYW